MSLAKVSFWLTAVVTIFAWLFYYYSNIFIVRFIGYLFVVAFALSIWRVSSIMGINRIAHGSPPGIWVPMLEQRKVLGFFRQYSESIEDRVLSISYNYAVLLFILGLLVHIWWLCLSALLLSFSVLHALKRSWPGYALILGGSKNESTRNVVLLVTKLIRPLFTVNLLDMVSSDELEHELFKATSYRLKNHVVSWESAVETHAFFARVIIIDLNETSDAVKKELEIIKDSNFDYKTVILDENNYLNSGDSNLSIDLEQFYVASSQTELVQAIKLVIEDIQMPPSREVPLKVMVSERTATSL